MNHSPVHCTAVVVDVAGFGHRARTAQDQMTVRDGLYNALSRTFHDVGIPWDECHHEDRGDGVLVLIPAHVPKCRFVDDLPDRLAAALTAHNHGRRNEERIRLRMALHAGEVHHDAHGVVGMAVNHAFRLLDARELRDTLTAFADVLALITSSWFYDEVIRHRAAARPDAYRQVHVTVKETSAPAWIRQLDGGPEPAGSLRVLAVDDERHALDDLVHLLRDDPRIGRVDGVDDSTVAMRYINQRAVPGADPLDAVFLDIRMPGLDGLDLARTIAQFATPPGIVFVTAFDQHAIEAFGLRAVDYLLKPVQSERLADTVNRLAHAPDRNAGTTPGPLYRGQDTIPVEAGGRVRFIRLADIRFVEAQGDYSRLHTGERSFLVRTPISVLEDDWAGVGFVRIHRSRLVAARHVEELRTEGGQLSVVVGGQALSVSRRLGRQVRDALVRRT